MINEADLSKAAEAVSKTLSAEECGLDTLSLTSYSVGIVQGHEYMTAAEVFMWGAAVGTVAANGGELFGE